MTADPSLVVFDMAGTTIKDTGHIPDAFAAAFRAHGLRATDAQIAQVRGASKREAVRLLVADAGRPADLVDAIYATFRHELARAYASGGIHPVEGAEDVFRTCRARGIRVALNTGLDRDIVELLLAAVGWTSGVVHAIVCGEDVTHGRPAPDLIQRAMELTSVTSPSQVANVGDTILDVQAGRNAGVRWNIAVCSGAHDRRTLEQEQPTHILPSVADLLSVF
jgi:phosphonatase-like hydrolase